MWGCTFEHLKQIFFLLGGALTVTVYSQISAGLQNHIPYVDQPPSLNAAHYLTVTALITALNQPCMFHELFSVLFTVWVDATKGQIGIHVRTKNSLQPIFSSLPNY